MSGKDFLKSHVLSWRRKVYSDWEDVTSSGRAFQVFGPATGKAPFAYHPRNITVLGSKNRRLVTPTRYGPNERRSEVPAATSKVFE